MAVALTLERASLQFAAIRVPLRRPAAGPALGPASHAPGDDPEQPPDLLPPPLPPHCAALAAALAAVCALASPALPFAAHVLSADALRVVVPKAHTAAVFKLLRAQQEALGVEVKDVKSHVSLGPLPAAELEAACGAGLAAALLHCGGWHPLGEERLLGASPLAPAPDGAAQACGALTLRVQAVPGDATRLRLLVKAEYVEFRHPACKPGASLEQRSAFLAGTPCCLLPDQRPALVQRLRPADAATLARLRPLWAAHGMPLPPEVPHLVEVSLDCDPDAPAFPYPPCRVLGQDGLQTVADKRAAPPVQAALARLRDDLAACPFKFFGDAARLAPVAHEWFPEGCPGPDRGRRQEAGEATQLAFTTARQLEQDGAIQGSTSQEAQQAAVLGAELRVADFAAGAAGGAGAAAGPRQRKVYAPVPSKLQAAFDEAKRQAAEAERPAGAPSRPAALPALSAATSKPPLAMRLAAAAAAGGKPAVPTFKKAAAAAAPAAAPKKAGGQKRAPAAGKPPTAPKRAKPAASATPVSAGAAAGGAAGDAGPPPSATKPKAAKPRAPAASAADVGGAGAAAPPKAPAKPRAKAADIDVTAVSAKVAAAHAAGGLGKLTIPELKAFLKSVKQPVGGKKGDLEARVQAHLGGGGGAAAAAAAPAAGHAEA